MKTVKIVLWSLLLLVVVVAAFGLWYKMKFSMGKVQPYSVNVPSLATHKIVIATQSSEFKDSVVSRVITIMKSQPVYIRVIDVSMLAGIDPNEWTSVVIIHTWEMGKPPTDVKAFVERTKAEGNIFIMATSGDGHYKMEQVDGITSASKMEEADRCVQAIVQRLESDMKNELK